MLTAFVFDKARSERVGDWQSALRSLHEEQLLWVALRDPTEEEVADVHDALGLGGPQLAADRLRPSPLRAAVADDGEHLYVTLCAVTSDERPTVVPLECVLGSNWIVTLHPPRRRRARRVPRAGGRRRRDRRLDAPSFLATIFEWVVAGYLRAFETVESELEELDTRVLTETPTRDDSPYLGRLVELRRTVGSLRRALSSHREVVFSLAHPELDVVSSEASAQRFTDLERRVTQALDAARDAKDSTFGTFDLLVARIGQRTNDIVMVLTLVTVILLPATLLAGIMGMNFQVGLFDQA